ncbi:MAG: AI-2E family transporter [Deltaproteobacteria bacterium]|nr:AI-2E family transporter [Deltaproteobacteria bacterium]
MRREQLFAAFFFVAFCFLLYQFALILSGFVGPLSYAGLLAFLLYPLHQRLRVALNRRDPLAAGVMTLATIVLVIAPAFYLLAALTTQSVTLYEVLRDYVTSGQLTTLMQRLQASRIGQWVTDLGLQTRLDIPGLLVSTSQTVSGFLVAQAPAAAANAFRFVLNLFVAFFALFFFFRDGDRMVAFVREMIPMEPKNKDQVVTRFGETLSAVVVGSVLTAIIQGTLGGLAYWALGVPFAVLLAVTTAFFSLLPVGTPLVWIGVALYFVLGGDYVRAAIMTGWGVLIVGSADNFIRPIIIGGRTEIPTVFLFFGILGGLQAYGFLGMFLGPAVIAILVAFARIYREQYGLASAPAKK